MSIFETKIPAKPTPEVATGYAYPAPVPGYDLQVRTFNTPDERRADLYPGKPQMDVKNRPPRMRGHHY